MLFPSFGKKPSKEERAVYQHSDHYANGKFQNLEPTAMSPKDFDWKEVMKGFVLGRKTRRPPAAIPNRRIDKSQFEGRHSAKKVIWLGHSSMLIRSGGKNILVDPVFSQNASPVSFAGVKAFNYQHPYTANDLPEIDIVLLTHDHYDHLDHKLMQILRHKVQTFIVPLGVAAHLRYWGIQEERIKEFDWWESEEISKDLSLTCTPARHFSGRLPSTRDTSLWCGWSLDNGTHRILIGGDSGYGEHFREIGIRLGPFDLSILECGQYNRNWPLIHMMPEETVQAAIDLKSKALLPVHWGRFSLSMHAWDEPPERVLKEASNLNMPILFPIPGETVSAPFTDSHRYWWREIIK